MFLNYATEFISYKSLQQLESSAKIISGILYMSSSEIMYDPTSITVRFTSIYYKTMMCYSRI